MQEKDKLTDGFKLKLEIFINGCDQKEIDLKWNREERGEMEAFYQNDLITFVISLMYADGKISVDEANYLNKTFGFEYSVKELREVHEFLQTELEGKFDDQLVDDVRYLISLDQKMGESFIDLLLMLCDIISQSDDAVAEEELRRIAEIRERLNAL
ncbi:MAG: TerB family tellurite resistance protein [Ruminococcus sp.]|uniref:tellurite resistance TerB family protein n=1 Tax=Ruminococcus sp. TaxID=41978 RepID=UPI002873F097|nr:hypothetical protein [Ruminococcus sp.]MBQ3284214.1 TerB family tellurite resistance protein [Ruminococcus sp.]